MKKREISLVKRRMKGDKSTSTAVYGYYVTPSGEIISSFNLHPGRMDENEQTAYFDILRQVLDCHIGNHSFLIPIHSEEQKEKQKTLLDALEHDLKDDDSRGALVKSIIDGYESSTNYLILLDFETMDLVRKRGRSAKDDADDSDRVFRYYVCAICPVTQGKEELSYTTDKEEFHNRSLGSVAEKPLAGFMFPTLEDESRNVNEVMFYAKKFSRADERFLLQTFGHRHAIQTQEQTRETFADILSSTMGDNCTIDFVSNMSKAVREMMTAAAIEAKASKDEKEEFQLGREELSSCLTSGGATAKEAKEVVSACEERLGSLSETSPESLLNTSNCMIQMEGCTVKVDASLSNKVSLKIVDGARYIMIRADGEEVTINGIPVRESM